MDVRAAVGFGRRLLYVWGGYYEDRSLIWRSRWITETGVIECREALAFPGDPSRAVVLRRIVAVDGDAHVTVSLDARAGFGDHPLTALACEDGVWTGRTGGLNLRWMGAADAKPGTYGRAGHDGAVLSLTLTVPAGTHHDLVLEMSDQSLPDQPPEPDRAWDSTERAWRDAVPEIGESVAPHDSRHAYAVLRGLTSSGGGMVAAATTSLPERAEEGRNYDYRYVWIRDQCFTGEAIAADGAHPLLDDAVQFVSARLLEDGPKLMPAYTTTGNPVPASHCTHPSGRWQRAPDDERVDAALLLSGIRGAVPADDPRTVATLAAVHEDLGRDGYVYRFRQQPGPLGEAEGAFLLCGFLAALATHQQGDTVTATRYFERNRGAYGPAGLYSEEWDVAQSQLRGNLPQAFVRALMFEAASRLAKPWDRTP